MRHLIALAAATLALAATGEAGTPKIVIAARVSPGNPLKTQTAQQYGRDDGLRVWVYVNGHELGQSEGDHHVAYYYARGTSVRLSVPAGRGPVKVSAVSTRVARVRVLIARLP